MKKSLKMFKRVTCLLGILFILLGLLPVPVLSSVGRVFAQEEVPPAEEPAPAEPAAEPPAEPPAPPAEEPALEPPAEEPAAEPPAEPEGEPTAEPEGEPTEEAPVEEVPMEPTVEAILETLEGETELEDLCPEDPDKMEPGACGCGVPDEDLDGNGIADCAEVEEQAEETFTPEVQALAEVGAVLENDSGEEVALGSEEAAEILATADPYYTSGGVTYRFLTDCSAFPNNPTNVCTESTTPIQAAINDVEGKILVNPAWMPDGNTIYVLAGATPYYENVTVSVDDLTLMGNPGVTDAAGAAINAPVLQGVYDPTTNPGATDVGIMVSGTGVSIIGFIIQKYHIGIELIGNGQVDFLAANNTIQDNYYGVANPNARNGVELHYNDFENNFMAVYNADGPEGGNGTSYIEAQNNYWGCPEGPVVAHCIEGVYTGNGNQKVYTSCTTYEFYRWESGNQNNPTLLGTYNTVTKVGTFDPYAKDCECLYGNKENHWDHPAFNWSPYKIKLEGFKTVTDPCGDGIWDQAMEDCDPTATPTGAPPGTTCSTSCTIVDIPALCPNGVLNAGETCDPPAWLGGSQPAGAVCRANCTFCGDGNIDLGFEECDGQLHCLADCTYEAFCGDGNVDRNLGETCDPLNDPNCRAAGTPDECTFCGDGLKQGDEQCDGGANCSASCTLIPVGCGDGRVDAQAGETCDPPRSLNGLCRDDCTYCGDLVIQAPEECDGGADCTANCTLIKIPPPPPPGGGGALLIPVTGPVEEMFIIPVTGLDMNFKVAGLQTLSLYMGMLLFGVTLVLEGFDHKRMK